MDEPSRDSKQLYVSSKMDESALDAFETRLLEEPELIKQVETDVLLREGMKQIEAELVQNSRPIRLKEAMFSFLGLVSSAGWSYAATGSVLVLTILLLGGSPQVDSGLDGVNVAKVVFLDHLRSGATESKSFDIPANETSLLVIDVFGISDDFDDAIVLRRSQVVRSYKNLQVTKDAQINLLVNDFAVGEYVLILSTKTQQLRYQLYVSAD